jgi:peptidoglycan/LPS O-acetylase OafA/YrhL
LMEHFPAGHAVRGGLPLAFLLTVIFATLSYSLYEAPFLRLKERFARIPSRPVG